MSGRGRRGGGGGGAPLINSNYGKSESKSKSGNPIRQNVRQKNDNATNKNKLVIQTRVINSAPIGLSVIYANNPNNSDYKIHYLRIGDQIANGSKKLATTVKEDNVTVKLRKYFHIWTKRDVGFNPDECIFLNMSSNVDINSRADVDEWIDEFKLNQDLCNNGIVGIRIYALWIFVDGKLHTTFDSIHKDLTFEIKMNHDYEKEWVRPYFLMKKGLALTDLSVDTTFNFAKFDLKIKEYCNHVSKQICFFDSTVRNLLLTLPRLQDLFLFSFIDVEKDTMCKMTELIIIFGYDCKIASSKFMYLIIILTAHMQRNEYRKWRAKQLFKDEHPENIYLCFSYVASDTIASCLLDADLIVFLAKNIESLQTIDYDEIRKNAATTLAICGNVYSQTSREDPFQQMQQSLQHINLLYLENNTHPHHNWYRTIKDILSTVTIKQDVINVTIQLLICVLSVVYGQTSIYVKPQKKCVKSASASESESNSGCSVMGGKSRRKTKDRKTRKNKLSKKTHRRSRK